MALRNRTFMAISTAGAVLMITSATATYPARASGSYDGHWKGEFGQGANHGVLAGAGGCGQFVGSVDISIVNDQVSGIASGRSQAQVQGTVSADGKLAGRLGQYPLEGSFAATNFKGSFATPNCLFSVKLEKIP